MKLAEVNAQYAEPTITGKPHASMATPDGYHKAHGKPRNKLNKGGTKRKGTLGYRTSRSMGKVRNPREGHVNPPAPITKRTMPTLEYVMGDSWNTANVAETAKDRTALYHWRGTYYPTWDDMQAAIEATAKG